MRRLLLDEMYPPALAPALQAHGIDAVAVLYPGIGLSGRSDEDVLQWATDHQRVVVTENVKDFALLAASMTHRGIVFVSSSRFPRTRNALPAIVAALAAWTTSQDETSDAPINWLQTP